MTALPVSVLSLLIWTRRRLFGVFGSSLIFCLFISGLFIGLAVSGRFIIICFNVSIPIGFFCVPVDFVLFSFVSALS